MANPRRLIYALYTHWDVIEQLMPLSREFPVFEQAQLLNVIGRVHPEKSTDEHEDVLRQLAASELLQLLPRDSALQIHPLVLDFVRGLTKEHELGLSAIIKARVEAIKNATTKLNEGLQHNQADQLRQAASQLAELFRQISQQLEQDRHAIFEIAERAKSHDANLPISQRYREVLEAYDSYVEPMAEMMDSGANGTFYRHLEAAEHALDHAVEKLSIQGALYSQRLAMRQVAFQAKELRRLGRDVLKHCSDTLLPLREEIRQHNSLSSSISKLLGQIRKRGLNRTLSRSELPLWRREQPRRITVGREVLSIMAEAMNYQPVTLDFPDEIAADPNHSIERIDQAELLQQLHKALPVSDLLAWLHQQYPDVSDGTLLRLYHELLLRTDWQREQAERPHQQRLNSVQVTHYPYRINSL